jgi:hypothetical protein
MTHYSGEAPVNVSFGSDLAIFELGRIVRALLALPCVFAGRSHRKHGAPFCGDSLLLQLTAAGSRKLVQASPAEELAEK